MVGPLPRLLSRILPLLLAGALLPSMLLVRLEARLHGLQTARAEDRYLLPGPDALRVLCLGHREAAAGVVWTRALVYFGEQVALRGPLRYLREHVDAVIGLDPDFRDAYEWASVITVYNTREITRRSVALSSHYLELGIRRFPTDGKLLTLLAFNYAIEMPPFARSDEEKAAFKRRAAELFERAARLPGAGRSAGLMAAELYTRTGQRELARRHLERLYVLTDDPELRAQAAGRLTQLLGEAGAEEALAEGRALFEGWTREFPYIPPDLYVLLRPRGIGFVDGSAANRAADAGPGDASASDAGPP